MANYVYNKVVCAKDVFDKYFLDDDPFGDKEEIFKKNPYITFNKLFNTKLDENYSEYYGEYIYYGDGFEYNDLKDGNVQILFNTKWRYPIKAIQKSLELCKEKIIWYVVEENLLYISKFYWKDEMLEEILHLEDRLDFEEFFRNSLEIESNFWIWEYKPEHKKGWKIWRCNDFEERYFKEEPAQLYYEEMRK